jgi:peptidoglycan/xylan/chitin deacetylase (PgdA/CDA1 family)
MKLALKIDVDTLRGTRAGVPVLADICQRHDAAATFLFSLGPDNTGRALRRVFRRGFLSKVRRTSVLKHYGIVTCLYGTLLPAPDIGRRCQALLREVRDRGFEVGIHTFDHVLWQDHVAHRDAAWTRAQMRAAHDRFIEIFGSAAVTHGAAGWQMNDAAFLAEDELGFQYASDTRGAGPFFPTIDGRTLRCLQLPTTLPTLDELIGRPDLGTTDPIEHLLNLTRNSKRDHVYTLHAELEGRWYAPAFERLLRGWREQGFELTSLANLAAGLDRSTIPGRQVCYTPVPGRAGTLALQC